MKLKQIIRKDGNLLELFRGSSVAFFFKFLSVLANYLLLYVLARYYGPQGLGIFSTSWTILMISTVIGKLGFDSSIVKFIAESISTENSDRAGAIYKKSVLFVLLSSALVAVILFAFADFFSNLFFNVESADFFLKMVSFTVIPLSLMQLNAESMKGLKRITNYSMFQNGSVYLFMLIALFIGHWYTKDERLILFALTAASGVLMIISFGVATYNFRQSGILIHKKNGDAYNRNILSVTLPMMFTNSLFLIMNWTDILMLSGFKDESAVGIYNAGLKIASLNTVALVAVNSIAAPKYAEIHAKNDRQGLRKIVKQTSLLNTLASLPVIAVIVIFPEWLLQLFGQEFTRGTLAMVILAFGQFFSAFCGSTLLLLNMTGREKIARNIIIISTVMNITLNYYLIPILGIEGAAISTASSTVLWNVIAVTYIFRRYGFFTYPIIQVYKMKEAFNMLFSKR